MSQEETKKTERRSRYRDRSFSELRNAFETEEMLELTKRAAYALNRYDLDELNNIIDLGWNINIERDSPALRGEIVGCHGTILGYAVSEKDKELVKYLISKGIDVNLKPRLFEWPLVYACRREDFEMVKLLVENGTDVNLGRCLYSAIRNLPIFKYLLENGADPNKRYGNHPLIRSLAANNKDDKVEQIELLVKYGAEIDATDKYGVTALVVACWDGRVKASKLLVKLGANVNGVKGKSMYPLDPPENGYQFADFDKLYAIRCYLIAHGAYKCRYPRIKKMVERARKYARVAMRVYTTDVVRFIGSFCEYDDGFHDKDGNYVFSYGSFT